MLATARGTAHGRSALTLVGPDLSGRFWRFEGSAGEARSALVGPDLSGRFWRFEGRASRQVWTHESSGQRHSPARPIRGESGRSSLTRPWWVQTCLEAFGDSREEQEKLARLWWVQTCLDALGDSRGKRPDKSGPTKAVGNGIPPRARFEGRAGEARSPGFGGSRLVWTLLAIRGERRRSSLGSGGSRLVWTLLAIRGESRRSSLGSGGSRLVWTLLAIRGESVQTSLDPRRHSLTPPRPRAFAESKS